MKQKQTIQKISKAKSWLFEKTNKADTPTSRKKKKRTQTTSIRDGKGVITEDPTGVRGRQGTVRTALCEHLCNVDEMHRLN